LLVVLSDRTDSEAELAHAERLAVDVGKLDQSELVVEYILEDICLEGAADAVLAAVMALAAAGSLV
jgi:hypothetical protein